MNGPLSFFSNPIVNSIAIRTAGSIFMNFLIDPTDLFSFYKKPLQD